MDRPKILAELERHRNSVKKWESLLAAIDDPEIASVLESSPKYQSAARPPKKKLDHTQSKNGNQKDQLLNAITVAGKKLTVKELEERTGLSDSAIRSIISQHRNAFTHWVGASDGLKRWGVAEPNAMSVETAESNSGGRLKQLKDFLAANGPSSRGDIIQKSGVPKGTISALLNEANGFVRDAAKRWLSPPIGGS